MANRWHVRAAWASVVLLLALPPAHSGWKKSELTGGPYEGRVTEAGSSLPVADALVLVKWMGTIPSKHSSTPVCYYHAVVTTGPDGRFVVPAWRESTKVNGDPTWLPYVEPLQVEEFVYKPGYRDEHGHGRARDPMKIELGRDNSAPLVRLKYLYELHSRTSCGGHWASVRVPWLTSIVAEAGELAKHSGGANEYEYSDTLAFALDTLRYGQEEAYVKERARLKQRKASPK